MTATAKVARASAKKVENLQAKLFKLLNGSAADLEFLEAVTEINQKDFDLAPRLLNQLGSSYLRNFLDILEQNTGCTSPAEDFIVNLALAHSMGGLLPAHVERYLEAFRENFESIAEESCNFQRRYAAYLQKAITEKSK